MGLIDLVKKAAFVDILRGMSVTGTYFVVDKVTVEDLIRRLIQNMPVPASA